MIASFVPFPAPFGAEVLNVAPATSLDSETLAAIKQALVQYHILLFRGRPLTPAEQVAFSHQFGELEDYPPHFTNTTNFPEIIRISNVPEEGYTNIGAYWHHDGSYQEKVTDLSFFHLLKVPDQGGDTVFADMHAAYEALPTEIKEMVEPLQTVHNNGTVHALVRRHPVSGRKALYLSTNLVGSIRGMDNDESRGLLDYLTRHISRPEGTYTQRWRTGDLMIVDNASVVHRAARFESKLPRLLQRTTTRGCQLF